MLWLVALMGVLALGILSLARNDNATAHAALDEVQAEGLADAGVYLVIHELSNRQTAANVPVDGSPRILRVGDHEVEVSVQDENGKIDLNYAPKELLTSLLSTVGLSQGESAKIVSAIQDRRLMASGNMQNIGNVTAVQTLQALPFFTAEQLKSIPGITDEIFLRIRPALTVYSQQTIVQTATAPKEALQALPGLNAQQVENVMAQRQNHPVTAGGIGLVEAMTGQGGTLGRNFTIISKARMEKTVFVRRAVVFITGIPQHPYAIMEWVVEETQGKSSQSLRMRPGIFSDS
ncbi:MAG: hypothetical protein WCD70_17250 [Alphaproteobacteria bacterium]